MNIDCDTCEVKGKACGDCFVSFLTVRTRTPDAVEMDDAQRRAVDTMVAGGLVPPLRLVDARQRRRAG
ncbi:hypothetical protein [Demequina sp. NBRC 110057]|uniref:hypothetical protein n=1 Tax=Demequina sp. NBRC 110057 TaxID=1570346 RepID=UPI0009FF9F91|nr:hypothetical protein [Demequina sp. NBRC 110057]